MLDRCDNPLNKSYEYYGGRGIGVCADWYSFEKFLSDMGLKPNRLLTLERCNNNKGYGPDNCKWATRSEQSSNQRFRRVTPKPVTLKPCAHCGKEINRVKPVQYAKRKYCSNACVGKAALTVTPETRYCMVCRRIIPMRYAHPGQHAKRKYCSHKCLGIAQRGITQWERQTING